MLDIYCINLTSRPDRWAHMQSVAKATGVDLIRVEAITPDHPECQQLITTRRPQLNRYDLLPTEVACSHSHYAAIQRFLDSGARHAIVLEDDMLLSPGFAAVAQGDWIPRQADIVRLEGGGPMTILSHVRHLKRLDRRIGRLRSTQIGTGAMVFSRAAARRLLARPDRFDQPIDGMLFGKTSVWFDLFNIYQMFPAPALQGKFLKSASDYSWVESTIDTERPALVTVSKPPAAPPPKRKKSLASRAARFIKTHVLRNGRVNLEITYG